MLHGAVCLAPGCPARRHRRAACGRRAGHHPCAALAHRSIVTSGL